MDAIRTPQSSRSAALSRVTLCELPAAARLLAKGATPSKAWANAALPLWLLGAYVIQPHLLRTATARADQVPPKVVVDGVVVIVPPGSRQFGPGRAAALVAVLLAGWAVPTFAALGAAYIVGGPRGARTVSGVLTMLDVVLIVIIAVSAIAGLHASRRDYSGRLSRSKSRLDRAAVRVFSASSDEASGHSLIWATREYIAQTYPGCQIELEARDERVQHTYERLGFTTVMPGHSKMVGTVAGERA